MQVRCEQGKLYWAAPQAPRSHREVVLGCTKQNRKNSTKRTVYEKAKDHLHASKTNKQKEDVEAKENKLKDTTFNRSMTGPKALFNHLVAADLLDRELRLRFQLFKRSDFTFLLFCYLRDHACPLLPASTATTKHSRMRSFEQMFIV